jgi:branched-subunit amino acid transport protein
VSADVWITIVVVTLASAAIRGAGPVFLGGRELPAAFRGVIALVAPAILAALVVVQTVGAPEGGAYEVDARVIGVGAAALVISRGAQMITVVAVATIVTALVRLLG